MPVEAILHTDPGCPWAYSAAPALAVLRRRFGEQLDWRLVTIGLTESAEQYAARGYTPEGQARGYRVFRDRFGMPFATRPRERVCGTGRACRAIVATRLLHPGREFAVLRALQLAWFTSSLLLDEDPGLRVALATVEGIDADAVVAALDADRVSEAYAADRAEARGAAGSPTEAQGKAANTDGVVRYTAPSLRFVQGERVLEAGGFQPLEAYDVVLANLDPALVRRPPAADALELLREFPDGLVTQEVAALMAGHLQDADRAGAEEALIGLVARGEASREPVGDDAIWRALGQAPGAG